MSKKLTKIDEVKRKCKNCRFFVWGIDSKGREVKDVEGFCLRYPKQEITNPFHWCGEWKKKDDGT